MSFIVSKEEYRRCMDRVASFRNGDIYYPPAILEQMEKNCDARHNPDSDARREAEAGMLHSKGLFDLINKTNYLIEFNFQPTSRAIIVKDDSVSSLSSKNTNKICNQLKKMIGSTMNIVVNNKIKIAKLDKVRTVKNHGKDVLRVTASSDEFNANGIFASDIIDLDETPITPSQATIDLFIGRR